MALLVCRKAVAGTRSGTPARLFAQAGRAEQSRGRRHGGVRGRAFTVTRERGYARLAATRAASSSSRGETARRTNRLSSRSPLASPSRTTRWRSRPLVVLAAKGCRPRCAAGVAYGRRARSCAPTPGSSRPGRRSRATSRAGAGPAPAALSSCRTRTPSCCGSARAGPCRGWARARSRPGRRCAPATRSPGAACTRAARRSRQRLPLAAAAVGGVGAHDGHAVGEGERSLQRCAPRRGALAPRDPRPHAVAGHGAAHEQHEAVRRATPCPP